MGSVHHHSRGAGRTVKEHRALAPMASSTEPEVIRERAAMRSWSRRRRRCRNRHGDDCNLAFVPTMGFLHEGHLSLVRHARAIADLVVVSIYVNPGQFSPSEDLSTYPSDLPGDLRKLAEVGGVDAVFFPADLYDYGRSCVSADSYGDRDPQELSISCIEAKDGSCNGGGHETWIRVEGMEKGLCGKNRPVFFRGVCTVVAKLFHIVEPDVAIFGKKDYQQWRIVSRMVRDLDFAVEVIGLDIVREPDGLAMSSRNEHLSIEEREKALSINRSLLQAKLSVQNGQLKTIQDIKTSISQSITEAGGRIDYTEVVEHESLEPVEEMRGNVVICVAAWFGKVRLIDNIELSF